MTPRGNHNPKPLTPSGHPGAIGAFEGIVAREQDRLVLSSLLRSSREESLEALRQRFDLLKAAFNLDLVYEHPYPAWPYKKDSLLNKTAHQVYQETFGEAATDLAIHAGLECGILLQKKPIG